MAGKRKPRPPKSPDTIPDYVLDGTGAHDAPTMTEILTKGAPKEVREFLREQSTLIREGIPLPAPVAEWLAAALEAITRDEDPEDANAALRVKKTARGPQPIGIRERAVIEHQIAGLVEQGVSPEDARGIVERFNPGPGTLSGKAPDDHAKAAERLRMRLRRKDQGTK